MIETARGNETEDEYEARHMERGYDGRAECVTPKTTGDSEATKPRGSTKVAAGVVAAGHVRWQTDNTLRPPGSQNVE